MRNLKKALSLVMAMAMLLSLMVVGAGAVDVQDFSDSDKIQNTEAVTTLVALGVINGKEDGSYDPEGIVTRAEMAKMICLILNGGKDPALTTKAVPTFTDIKGNWAEAYIEYCVSLEIVAGKGDGTFEPSATVTGSEAAKMALVALGYDAGVFGFTGADWAVKTNSRANMPEADLYDNLAGINVSAGLTRDNAAQLLFNALDAKVMTRSYDKVESNGEVSYSYELSDKTLIENRFNAVKVEGVVIANEAANLESTAAGGSSLDAIRTRIRVTNYGTGSGEQNTFGNTAGTAAITIQASTGLNELGRAISVYVKNSSSTSRAEVLGSVIVSSDNAVVTNYSGDTIAKVADDNNLDLTSSTKTALNYANLATYAASVAGNATRGVEKILIDNDADGDVDYVLLNTYRFGKVTSYVTSSDGSITVNCGSSNTYTASDADDVAGFEDVTRNDYVLAAEIGGKLYVEKAESVTGELGGFRQSDASVAADISASSAVYTNRLSVDGTNYNVAWLTGYTGGTDNITPAYNYGANNLDNSATFYLGKGDYVMAVGDVTSNAYNYALVLAKDTGINNQVRVALSDGTVATYNLSASGNNVKFTNVEVGEVYGYTLNGTNGIRLNAPTYQAVDYNSTNVTFTKGRTSVGANGTYYANASTVFFYVSNTQEPGTPNLNISGDDVDVYTGYTNAPTLNSNITKYASVYTRAASGTSSSNATVVVFRGTGLASTNVDDNLYIYSRGNSNNSYTEVNAFVAGSADVVENLKTTGDVTAEGIRTYTIDSDGYYSVSIPTTYNGRTGNLLAGYTVSASNAKTFVITDGTTAHTYELEITADTLLINDSSYLDDPTAELGAGPEEDDNIAYILFSLDNGKPDEAKLIVIKNTNSSGNQPIVSTDVDVISTSYATPEFYRASGTAITVDQMLNALEKQMIADGCTNITFDGYTSVSYTPAGTSTTRTVYFNGGSSGSLHALTRAANQVYKVTVNGTANYYVAGSTFKNTSSTGVDLSGTNCYINGSNTPTVTTIGHTVNSDDTDTTIVDGYYSVAESATQSVTNSAAGLSGATVTYSVAEGYVQGTLTVTLTSSAQSTAAVTATVTGTGVITTNSANVSTIASGAFTGSNTTWTTTITVPVDGDISANSLTIVLSTPT